MRPPGACMPPVLCRNPARDRQPAGNKSDGRIGEHSDDGGGGNVAATFGANRRGDAGGRGAGRAGRCRSALPQHRQLRGLARRLQEGGGGPGHLAPGDLGGARRRNLRPGHHPARQRAGRVPAELHSVRQPHDRGRPLPERIEAIEGERCAVVADRAADRSAAGRGGRAVGPRKRLRRLQGWHLQHHPLGRDLGLRLPALGFFRNQLLGAFASSSGAICGRTR